MWRWTGDDAFRNDPVFQRFFRITMSDYIKVWQLTPDTILKRPRIANQRQEDGRFVHSHGIPSYTEDSHDFIFGTDLLAAEYRAIRSFQEIAASANSRKLAQDMQSTADAIQTLLERVAWSETQNHYLGTIRRDLTGQDPATHSFSTSVLPGTPRIFAARSTISPHRATGSTSMLN